jgi:hypothetical protein
LPYSLSQTQGNFARYTFPNLNEIGLVGHSLAKGCLKNH